MSRVLLLIILLWVLYIVLKRFIAFTKANSDLSSKPSSSEKIVACSHCGLHIPESETLTIGHTVYCNNPDCHPNKP